MIHVDVTKESNFPISTARIKEAVKKILIENGIVSDSQVSVAVVRRETMKGYADKYLKDGDDHPVLSFPSGETPGRFVYPDDNLNHLGEIIVSYDWCVDEAGKTGRLVEDVALEMTEHGSLHLIGIHHD